MTPALDNGRSSGANRVYCASGVSDVVMVVDGTTNALMRGIAVGSYPKALAWNPAHSWMYVANHYGSSITVLRDTLVLGVEENRPWVSSRETRPTFVAGVLFLPGLGTRSELPERNSVMSRAALLDISGRKVLDLKSGANDVRALAPGVYFLEERGVRREEQESERSS